MKIKCGMVALGNGKCWICGCITAKRGMTVHHLWYLKNNDIIYKNYPKNDSGSLQYYTELYPKVVKTQNDSCICVTHTISHWKNFVGLATKYITKYQSQEK